MKIKNYFQTFVIPAKVFRQLLMEENQLRTAFVLILIPLVLYTIIYILLAASGGGVNSFEPWLNISKEKY